MLPSGNLAKLVYLNNHPHRAAHFGKWRWEEREFARTTVDSWVKRYSRVPLAARVIMRKMDPERMEKLQECWEVLKVKATHFTILSRARPLCAKTSKWIQKENPYVAGKVIYLYLSSVSIYLYLYLCLCLCIYIWKRDLYCAFFKGNIRLLTNFSYPTFRFYNFVLFIFFYLLILFSQCLAQFNVTGRSSIYLINLLNKWIITFLVQVLHRILEACLG